MFRLLSLSALPDLHAMDDETADGFTSPSLHGRPLAPEPTPSAPSRRGLLIGGGVAIAAAVGGGVAAGIASSTKHSPHKLPFVAHVAKDSTAAVDAERTLLATVDSALVHAHGATKRLLRAIRDDHAEHLAALTAAVRNDAFPAHAPKASSSTPAPAGSVRVADVRKIEQRAARAAAARAMRLSGRDAALLASIAASEASHAELLS